MLCDASYATVYMTAIINSDVAAGSRKYFLALPVPEGMVDMDES